MDIATVFNDAFDRIHGLGSKVVRDLDPDALVWRPDAQANSIAWLVWHLTRVQDSHVSEIAGRDQVWAAGAWAPRFGLAAGVADTGYGHTPEQVAQVAPADAAPLGEYLDRVTAATRDYLSGVDSDELDRVIDRSYDPPVTVAVRLVSVVSDGLQHVGQAAYVRGLYERSR